MSTPEEDRTVLIGDDEGIQRRAGGQRRRRLLVGAIAAVAFFMVAFVVGFSVYKMHSDEGSTSSSTLPIKSEYDPAEYKTITLPNGLRAVLTSNPYCGSQFSTAMRVAVGSSANPNRTLGAAHLLEHMLFLGTKKYPELNEFHKLVNSKGGATNAYTANSETMFYFHAALETNTHAAAAADMSELLDHFSQFFVDPLLSEKEMSKEMLAVASENAKNLNQDGWREYQLRSSLFFNPAHPYSRFATGDMSTLNHSWTYADMRAVHDHFYLSHRMSLAVVSSQPIDVMERLVRRWFGLVSAQPRPAPKGATFVDASTLQRELETTKLVRDKLGVLVKFEPISNSDSYSICWEMRSATTMYKTKSLDVIAALVADKGAGSLYAHLNAHALAESVSVAIDDQNDAFHSMLCINLQLTKKGVAAHEQVGIAVVRYMRMIASSAARDLERVWHDLKRLAALAFKHTLQPPKWDAYAQAMAARLVLYDSADLIRVPFLYETFNASQVHQLSAACDARRAFVMVGSPSFRNLNQTEKWYGTKYELSALGGALLNSSASSESPLDREFSLPNRSRWAPPTLKPYACNDFQPQIPPNFSSSPKLSLDSKNVRIWFKADDQFCAPRGTINLDLISNRTNNDVRSYLTSQLALNLASKALLRFTAEAAGGGIGTTLTLGSGGLFPSTGLRVEVSGYSALLAKYTVELVGKLRTVQFKDNDVPLVVDAARKTLNGALYAQPYAQCLALIDQMLQSATWSAHEQLEVINNHNFTASGLQRWWNEMLGSLHVEMLVYGNFVERTVVDALHAPLVSALRFEHLADADLPRYHLQLGTRGVRDELYTNTSGGDSNSVVMWVSQIGSNDTEQFPALANTLNAIIAPVVFETLRTVQQLGYIVFSNTRRAYNIFFNVILVQSGIYSPDLISKRMEALMHQLKAYVHKFDKARFSALISHLVLAAANTYTSGTQEATAYWFEILRREYHFHRDDEYVSSLKRLKLSDVQLGFDTYLDVESTSRRVLSILSYGSEQRLPSNLTSMPKVNKIRTVSAYEAGAVLSGPYPTYNFSNA